MRPRIDGAFFQLNSGFMGRGRKFWAGQLEAMANVGMKTVIIQASASETGVFYGTEDYQYLFGEAEARGFEIWLGLALSSGWWSGKLDLVSERKKNLETAQALEDLYGASPALAGWYIPHEVYPVEVIPQEMAVFFSQLTRELKGLGRPLSMAPYFGPQTSVEEHVRFWDQLLTIAPIDVLMLQDGVGCRRIEIPAVPPIYRAVAEVCQKHGTRFWTDLEVFDQISDKPLKFVTGPFPRIREQLMTQAPLVEKVVIFDWPHYMSPLRGTEATQLYQEYLSYLQS